MLHRTNDSYRATNPEDEFLGPEPEDEDELPEPTVEEVWDPMAAEYVTTVTFASGSKFTIVQVQDPRSLFVGDYSIYGDGFYSNGWLSPEKAIEYLTDPERRDW